MIEAAMRDNRPVRSRSIRSEPEYRARLQRYPSEDGRARLPMQHHCSGRKFAERSDGLGTNRQAAIEYLHSGTSRLSLGNLLERLTSHFQKLRHRKDRLRSETQRLQIQSLRSVTRTLAE